MTRNLIPALRLTAVTLVIFSGLYTLAVWGAAQVLPTSGLGTRISHERGYFYANIGQVFSEDRYFWSRPSAVDYNAAGSCGSNKGPTNPDYLTTVQARTDSFLVHNPGVRRTDVPADLVTASGSGLDPHISPQAAMVQVARVAKARGLETSRLEALVRQHTEPRLLGIFGKEKINALRLNLALDAMK